MFLGSPSPGMALNDAYRPPFGVSGTDRLDPVKKVFVKSYGCQMNVYDAARMADVLGGEGYTETGAMEEAALVILNTCHIREKAAEKVYSELGRLRLAREERRRDGRDTSAPRV